MFIDWRPAKQGHSEYFQLGSNQWRVEKAKEILRNKPRKSKLLVVADWKGLCEVVEKKANPVDLKIPIICARFGKKFIPIDGWNRIRLAVQKGIATLEAVHLTATESKEVACQ
jgi:hypothetical protein